MAAYVGPAALKAMGGGAVAAGGAAIASGAATNASISLVNNRGDLGAVWQDTTSSDALKGYAISGITAGLTQGYFNDWTGATSDLTGKITVDLGSLKGIGQFAASQGLQNGTALALGRIMGQGGDLGDALQSTLLNTLAAVSFNAVGDYTKGVYADGSIQKVMIHAMVGGLLAEASGGDFKTGALAAGANEALVDQLDTWVGGNKILLDMTSQLVGLLAASTLDGADAQSLQTGAWVAQNATQYNHELHRKNAESFAEGALDFCKKQPAYCGPGADQVSEQDLMDALAATAAHGEGIDKVKPEALRLVNQFLVNPDLADTLQNDLFAPTASEQQRLDTLEKAELAAAGVSAAALAKAVIAGGGQLLSKVVGALKGQGTKGFVGFSDDAAKSALSNVGRVDHSARHLIDAGIITANSGSKAARQAFQEIGQIILTNPAKTFDHVMTQGGQAVKGFYGKIDGNDVVIFVAKESRGKIAVGDIVTAIKPSSQQMKNFGL
ncbi:DUF637 domain-containing protein [Pseudomonas sp. 273]|uniref:DUF637 domain-containing protein n=1 Tax=Pseudomonas sp. 273 TaxID=75692 RepID=UPI0023D7FA95|nr:DUF637 domain-containing protein [Pseudomonas sp. 273]